MHRDVVNGEDARQKMKQGIDKAVAIVQTTMGVRGKNIILDTNPYEKPLITNDGVTILRNMSHEDKSENAGLKMLKEAAEKTNDNAGDGTTTTAILLQSIIDQGMKVIAAGADGIALREGIKSATDKVITNLKNEKVDASDETTLADTATISCRDPKIGHMIASVVKQADKDGMITLEDTLESDTSYKKRDGLRLRGGYLHEMFINLPERRQTVFSDVPILVTDKSITTAQEMGRIMETVSNMGKKQAVVIANSIEGDALATAVVNWTKNAIHILPVRVITYGEAGQGALRDVAAITGATYLDEHEKNIVDITQADFGRADTTVTDRHETTIITSDKKLKEERIKDLQAALKDAKEFESESIRERIAKLKSAMFTIKVGGKTESERNELKTRIDDAIKAAKAALESGVVAGGGSALYRAVQAQEKPDVTTDEGIGESIVYKACLSPINQMAVNSSYTLDKTDLNKLKVKKKAINFKTCEVVDAFTDGIVDPLKVVVEAVQNASSEAALFLTLEGAVLTKEAEQAERI